MQVDKPFISVSHLHKRFGAQRSSSLRIRALKVVLHERIPRHVGYVLITHTFPLEGGVILRHALKESVPVIMLVICVVKFVSHMRMPQCILKIVKLIKISVFHLPGSKYPRSTLSNFLTHFSVNHTVIT